MFSDHIALLNLHFIANQTHKSAWTVHHLKTTPKRCHQELIYPTPLHCTTLLCSELYSGVKDQYNHLNLCSTNWVRLPREWCYPSRQEEEVLALKLKKGFRACLDLTLWRSIYFKDPMKFFGKLKNVYEDVKSMMVLGNINLPTEAQGTNFRVCRAV